MSLLDEVLEAREIGRQATINDDFDGCVKHLKKADSKNAWTNFPEVAARFKDLGFKVEEKSDDWVIYPERG